MARKFVNVCLILLLVDVKDLRKLSLKFLTFYKNMKLKIVNKLIKFNFYYFIYLNSKIIDS